MHESEVDSTIDGIILRRFGVEPTKTATNSSPPHFVWLAVRRALVLDGKTLRLGQLIHRNFLASSSSFQRMLEDDPCPGAGTGNLAAVMKMTCDADHTTFASTARRLALQFLRRALAP